MTRAIREESVFEAALQSGQRADRVAQASPPASFRTVPVLEMAMRNASSEKSGGETPAELATGTAMLHCNFAPEARDILSDLLEKFATDGEHQFWVAVRKHQPEVLKVPPISHQGNVAEIIGIFGSADQLRNAVNQLQPLVYEA